MTFALTPCTRPFHVTAFFVGLTISAILSARADEAGPFSSPPYVMNQSVIGIDGWEYRIPTAEDHRERSRVVALRWNGYKPALMLKGANLKKNFPPAAGTEPGARAATIVFDAAFTFPDRGGTGRQFRLGFVGAPLGEIFMELGSDGGLGYLADGSGKGGVVALKNADMKVNSFYRFVVTINYVTMNYEVAITGVRKDGTGFQHESGKTPFRSNAKGKGISGLYLLSGGNITVCLGSLSVTAE